MPDGPACYLLVGQAAAIAERIAVQYKDCPYVHFIFASGSMLIGTWHLPEVQRWWLERIALPVGHATLRASRREGYSSVDEALSSMSAPTAIPSG